MTLTRRLQTALLALGFITMQKAHAQAAPLTFDVASIRPSAPDAVNGMIKALPNGHGYTAQNISIKLMISLMYKVPMRQISGGPAWLESDRYDVEARSDGSYSLDDLHTMYQNLLAERLQLRFHTETRQGPVYVLSVDHPEPGLKPNTAPQDFNIPITFAGDGSSIGRRVPMKYFAWWLGNLLQQEKRPVVDRTGLTGYYDFTLAFAPVLPPDVPRPEPPPGVPERPSIFTALREQLGLKLTPETGPVEYLLIDSVQRPSQN